MKRFIYGLVALFFALLLVRASAYGAVGHFIAQTSERAIGSAGVALLVAVLFVVAFRLLVPARVRRWLLSYPFERAEAAQVVAPRQPRRRAAPRQQLVVVTGADLQGLGLQGLIAAMNGGPPSPEQAASVGPQMSVTPARMLQATPTYAPEPELAYEERRRREMVTSALKQLSFTKGEYEPVLAKMDFKRPADDLLRDAVLALRRPDVARVVRPS